MLLVRLGYEHPVPNRGRLARWYLSPPLEESTRISASVLPAPDPDMSRGRDNSQVLWFGHDHCETPVFNPCSKKQISPSSSVPFTSNGG